MVYCDTSFILSLFVQDAGSELADRQIRTLDSPVAWSEWHELEFVAALEARIGRGVTSREEGRAIETRLREFQESGFFELARPADWSAVYRRAVVLGKSHGAQFINRGLDILHVALCEELGITAFWSRDDRQRKLAAARGLNVNRLD